MSYLCNEKMLSAKSLQKVLKMKEEKNLVEGSYN